ncbi:Hypothetical_protein [Hexamita inflata]|uniref:Hypothetical_protein n=1 Tax=Hexamita inflata TaxID=28002 RepID=A0AA86NTU7_9EUKA|nr:Hypothetical protein HINF_LOCUS13613 [Hexamita inflata]CAI9926000.1 Hypothetical protein HINF_LOCUS13645 [Hexamita inflata]CAI9933921.1 Hypothetical protein HINF_LOCUS21566 [Hexamita inflata]
MALRKRQLCSSAQPSDQYQLTQKSNLILNLHIIDGNKQYQTVYGYLLTSQKQLDLLCSSRSSYFEHSRFQTKTTLNYATIVAHSILLYKTVQNAGQNQNYYSFRKVEKWNG